jgi:sulfur relay (sulfurtransferase) complex TusBCD TusD component (DsrE family)
MDEKGGSAGMLVMVTGDGMGQSDSRELRHGLFGKWLALVRENGRLPGAICFYTDGVRLVCNDSPFVEQLRALQEAGVHLVICKTCLDTYGLTDQVAVGVVGGMGDIIAAQWKAEKIVTL